MKSEDGSRDYGYRMQNAERSSLNDANVMFRLPSPQRKGWSRRGSLPMKRTPLRRAKTTYSHSSQQATLTSASIDSLSIPVFRVHPPFIRYECGR